jgi:peptidoglycan/LPS O-acetylase OafA/YrhL
LSWCFHFHREKLDRFIARYRWWLAAGGATLLVPPFVWELNDQNWYLHTLGLTTNALGSGALLLAALHFPFRLRPIAFIGVHSYSIYLWHIPIGFLGLGWISPDWPPFVGLTIYFVLTIGLGIIMAKLVETPFLALRDRLFPTRSAIRISTQPPKTIEGSPEPRELALVAAG